MFSTLGNYVVSCKVCEKEIVLPYKTNRKYCDSSCRSKDVKSKEDYDELSQALPIINNETDLMKYLKGDDSDTVWNQHFPGIRLLAFEHPVLGCISRRRIGAIDIFCQKNDKGQKYFIEVKHSTNTNGDFWDSFKVIAYVKSQNMYFFNEDIKPAIMVKKNILKYDFRAVLGALNISWVAYNLDGDNRLLNFEINL